MVGKGITKKKKKKIQKLLKEKGKKKKETIDKETRNFIKNFESDLKKKGYTKTETILTFVGIVLGIVILGPAAIGIAAFLIFAIISMLGLGAATMFRFGKSKTRKKFLLKIKKNLIKDLKKMKRRKKKIKITKKDRAMVKKIQKELKEKGYTKIESMGIIFSSIMGVPQSVGIEFITKVMQLMAR
tara:strand:+ start:2643 stop:3197 length:555 start_codon:yes stop_codon:yes gene_type:complete